MVITPFPTSVIIPKSSPCTGLLVITEMKDITDDIEEKKTQPWNISIELEQISRSESSESMREEQESLIKARQCSGRKAVCPKQRSGEVCSPIKCCHMCTGQISRQNFSDRLPEIDQHPQTHEQRHSIAPGSGSGDTNSDSDEQLLSGWHEVEEHRLRFHEHEDEIEVDHGGHRRVNPFNQPLMNPFHQILDSETLDLLEVEDFQYSVQETSSNLSKRKEEIVFGKELLLLQKEEKRKRPYFNVKHVFSRPFVCNMPPFVREQYM